jgi:hypothetical protein
MQDQEMRQPMLQEEAGGDEDTDLDAPRRSYQFTRDQMAEGS